MAQHHFGGAQRGGEIVRGQANAEIGAGNAQRAQHRGRQHRIGAHGRRPGALDQPAADHQIGARHPRLEQAINRHARMAAIGRAHRHRIQRIAQQRGPFLRIDRHGPGQRIGARRAPRFHPARQRTAIGLGPQHVAAQRLARLDQPRQPGIGAQRRGIIDQRAQDRQQPIPPCHQIGIGPARRQQVFAHPRMARPRARPA